MTLAIITGCGQSETFDLAAASEDAIADFSYTIPLGAGKAQDDGAALAILPAVLEATVGQTIEIVNDDIRGHLIGPWFVGAGETLRQRFASQGEFIGDCSVHPSGQIKVLISA